jgi:hypothetical protein
MANLKPDAAKIKSFLDRLANEDWVKRSERRWWPRFLFHYTDIRNAIEILKRGVLYSRQYLEQTGQLAVSSGSSAVLSHTETSIKECVRFYFRPKTPTQYWAEGMYSQTELAQSKFPDAHCPVPIFFLFDAAGILSRQDCWFSDGSLASSIHQPGIYSTAADLEQLPWKKIYHNQWIDRSSHEESDIVLRRHAEAIVFHQLGLNDLRYIYCRSEAERETLLYLLPESVRRRYQNKIVATTRSDLFFRRQTYIESVRLSSTSAILQFSPETKSPGLFHLRIEILNGDVLRVVEQQDFDLRKGFSWKLPLPEEEYAISIFLDRNLAYSNAFADFNIPF